ncbi:histone acetyltransferase KAT2A-like [Drosophila busckii]|uniref:histone acetyltransferase KAT2A-like n=1 Tax=Drosophila busckii TaxID=30019 RepID=UPI00083ECFE9|nr:histone acetyltransferase KAT2A-like [Drosophila busckii]
MADNNVRITRSNSKRRTNEQSGPAKRKRSNQQTAEGPESATTVAPQLGSSMSFHLIEHETIEKCMDIMLSVKSVYMETLPKMPPKFISKMMFDGVHKTLALLVNGSTIGAICFRLFPDEGFTEITFCAVTMARQNEGFGRYLMNMLKDFVGEKGIMHLLTHADCNAVGYFRKQGFSENIGLPLAVYRPLIKEYDNAKLMHIHLEPGIRYTQPKLHLNTHNHLNKVDSFEMSLLTNLLGTLLKYIKQQKDAWPFLRPVSTAIAPGYYEYIQYPMDLQTMEQRLKRGYYISSDLFIADMKRIFSNCHLYNDPNQYTRCADNLECYFNKQMRGLGLMKKN